MNRIAWESLNYDFLEDEDDDDMLDDLDDFDEDEDEDDEDDEFGFITENINNTRIIMPVMKKIVQTPLGYFDISNQLNPLKNYQLWIMHSNFNLSVNVLSVLSKLPGIELVKPYGRYRCIIGIGKLFSFREVRLLIEKTFCASVLPEALTKAIDECKQYKYWGVCMMPNGYIEKVHTESLTPSFEATLVEFKEAEKMEALVYTHDVS